MGKILNIQKEQGIAAALEGSNIGDNGDYRPGLQAVAALGILSPLPEHGFTNTSISFAALNRPIDFANGKT